LVLDLSFYWGLRFIVGFFERFQQYLDKTRSIKKKLDASNTYNEWRDCAKLLDHVGGYDKWKSSPTQLFDERLVKRVTSKLRRDRKLERPHGLIDTFVTSAIKSDLGGINNEELYSRCYYGTKSSLEEYFQEVIRGLEYLGNCNELDFDTKYTFFKHASRLYGKSALCLSGGATLAWFHGNVVLFSWGLQSFI
jgi:hypothetical protein